MATQVTDIRSKKSGKRSGGGHTGLPSDSARRAAGNSKADSEPAETPKKKRKSEGKAVVSRLVAKQGELPGVSTGNRKIVEIEDLADKRKSFRMLTIFWLPACDDTNGLPIPGLLGVR